jgi:transposase InsO family protein
MDQGDIMSDNPNTDENGGNNFPLELPDNNMVPSNTRKDTRLPYFSGDKNTIPFAEWWIRFLAVAKANEWSVEDQARKLPGLTTKRPFEMLNKLLVSKLTAEQKLELYRSTLQKKFGLSPEKAFNSLCNKKFDLAKEDVDQYANELVHLIGIVFPKWEPEAQDTLATRFFWQGLPTSVNCHQLLQLFKRDEDKQTLNDAVDICRDGFEAEAHVHAIQPSTYTHSRPGKGRGKGKGWHIHHPIRRPQKNFKTHYFLRCKQCGGRGHKEDVCPTSQQVCSNMIIQKCHSTGLSCLIDTGASVSILNLRKAPGVHTASSKEVRTISGTKTLDVVPYYTIMGVVLKNCLGHDGPLMTINGVEIDGILGMDYIQTVGGLCITFDHNNRPSIDFMTPLHVLNAIQAENTLFKRIEMKDFTLEQHLRLDPEHPEWRYKWVAKWNWIEGPQTHFGPPSYNADDLPCEHKALLQKEVQSWLDSGFIEPVSSEDRHQVQGLLSLIAVEQLHKPSTPVRPVLDYRWLNKLIHSCPNEGLDQPVSAPNCLRRWRSHPDGSMCLIDIKKAYLQISIDKEQTWFQCFRYPSHDDVYRLKRLGFGLSISPKVLRVVLSEILPADTFPSIDTYIDDNFLPVSDITQVRERLREHGFETKEPEPVNTSRVLGLQNSPDGTWRRRGATPQLEKFSKRGVHSWTGKLVCHLPIAGWLRPCASALKRLCSGQDWDDPLDAHALRACERLGKWLLERGDPCQGIWSFDASKPWTLYTDASSTAYGAVLLIGEVYVEDQTYLRAPGDRRHINLAELIAVHKGIHLVALYRKALRMSEATTISLKCDNKSVVAWLTRAQERHWTTTKGLSAKVIEKQLTAITDDCQALGIKLKVDLIPSEENISDPLSRVPEFLRPPEAPFDTTQLQSVICTVLTEPQEQSTFERDEYNRWKIDSETLVTIMTLMHEHEGAQALYDRLRGLVAVKDLRRHCQQFVKNCAVCSMSKVTQHTPVQSEDAHMPEAVIPFTHVHMDISGPYGSIDDIDKFYVISLIDRFSRYVLTKSTGNAPLSTDCSELLRATFERFHVCVDFVYTDEGSQFVSAEFTRVAADLGCSVITTPVRSSWANGRVERWHRILNDHLRAHLGDGFPAQSFRLFDRAVARATLLHNTTRSSRTGDSPHDLVFTFPSWIYPNLKQFRPPPVLPEYLPTLIPVDHPLQGARLPQVGEIWLYRTQHVRKLERPYVPCRIVGRLSRQVYLIRFRTRAVKKVHLRHLKPLTPEAATQLPELPLPVPPDDRPLRDLKGGGGHVVV